MTINIPQNTDLVKLTDWIEATKKYLTHMSTMPIEAGQIEKEDGEIVQQSEEFHLGLLTGINIALKEFDKVEIS